MHQRQQGVRWSDARCAGRASRWEAISFVGREEGEPGRKATDKLFYLEVGRLVIRETEKGVSGTLYLHHLDGDFAVFPSEKRDENPA